MFTLLFTICFLAVFGRMIGFAVSACWGLLKVLFTIIFLPVFLIILVFSGLLSIAFPLLIVIGIWMLIKELIIT